MQKISQLFEGNISQKTDDLNDTDFNNPYLGEILEKCIENTKFFLKSTRESKGVRD